MNTAPARGVEPATRLLRCAVHESQSRGTVLALRSLLESSMLRPLVFAAAVFALPALPAAAAEVEGVKLPDTVKVAGSDLVLNGAGLRSKVVFKVYVGSLYLKEKATDLAGVLKSNPRRIQLNLTRTLKGEQLVEAFDEGLKDNNSAAELEAVKAGHDQMKKILLSAGEVKEGGIVTMDFADDKTTVSVNGKALGVVDGAGFNKAFTKIWLGTKPVQADLKSKLLGG
jgi:hypothetical protein